MLTAFSLIMLLSPLLGAAGERIADDPLTAAIGGLVTILTGINVGQSVQMHNLRTDFQTYRTEQDKRVQRLEERVDRLEEDCGGGEDEPPPRSRKKITGSQSTTRGRAPRENIRESGTGGKRKTYPGDIR